MVGELCEETRCCVVGELTFTSGDIVTFLSFADVCDFVFRLAKLMTGVGDLCMRSNNHNQILIGQFKQTNNAGCSKRKMVRQDVYNIGNISAMFGG